MLYRHQAKTEKTEGGFLSFLFPRSVWSHPDAWLDVRYFFFHGLIGHFLLFGCITAGILAGIELSIGTETYEQLTRHAAPNSGFASLAIAVIALLIITFLSLIHI